MTPRQAGTEATLMTRQRERKSSRSSTPPKKLMTRTVFSFFSRVQGVILSTAAAD
jgi:hypothetical protein